MRVRGEPVIWIDWLVEGSTERFVSLSAVKVLKALPDADKRHILTLLGGLYQLVLDIIESREPGDEALFDAGRRQQIWAAFKDEKQAERGGG